MKERHLEWGEALPDSRAVGMRLDQVDRMIDTATRALLSERRADGHWCFEL